MQQAILKQLKALPIIPGNYSTGSTGNGNDFYHGSSPSSITLGGITVGTTLTGKTYTQLFEQLLMPYQSPTLGNLFMTAQSTAVDVNTVVSGNKTFTWTSTNNGNIQPNSLAIRDVTTNTILASNLANDFSEVVNIGSIVFDTVTSHSWRVEGTNTNGQLFFSPNLTMTSNYPCFWGKVSSGGAGAGENRPTLTNIQITGGSKFNANPSSTFTISMGNTIDQYFWFATPASFPTRTIWNASALNNGTIGGAVSPGGNLFPAPYIMNLSNPLWSNIPYKIYLMNYQAAVNQIEFRVF